LHDLFTTRYELVGDIYLVAVYVPQQEIFTEKAKDEVTVDEVHDNCETLLESLPKRLHDGTTDVN
jgi:hypothetical protein